MYIRNIINIIMFKRDIPPILNLNTYRFVYFKHNYIFIDYIIPNLKRIDSLHLRLHLTRVCGEAVPNRTTLFKGGKFQQAAYLGIPTEESIVAQYLNFVILLLISLLERYGDTLKRRLIYD